jgi:hypothetical protein
LIGVQVLVASDGELTRRERVLRTRFAANLSMPAHAHDWHLRHVRLIGRIEADERRFAMQIRRLHQLNARLDAIERRLMRFKEQRLAYAWKPG